MNFPPKIAIIGLGYVGLPVAVAFAKKFDGVIGFDINHEKISELKRGIDRTGEVGSSELAASSLKVTAEIMDLKGVNFFIVAVPTPVDQNHNPDLTPVIKATESIAQVISKGAIVVYESTVYPGVTEEICGPVIEKVSGLKQGKDFKLGYSPERINPGDKEHTFERIIKIVSGEDEQTLEIVAQTYGAVVTAGVHRASSIKVAEAAKVIENTQRDLNIALMNELALIFDRLNIRTTDVLAAAGTKWNFLNFKPGLVGGHCIGVDPYYLTTKAEQVKYHPQVILAGRRINDGMGSYIANRTVKLLANNGVSIKGARVGVLGITFKENIPDIRNSRVPDIVHELESFGVQVQVVDPMVTAEETHLEYGIKLSQFDELKDLDAIILAVSHRDFAEISPERYWKLLGNRGILVDVKGIFTPDKVPQNITYWSL
jgi:UDP-N-acetyl-D-galactosamine dehydrogenase